MDNEGSTEWLAKAIANPDRDPSPARDETEFFLQNSVSSLDNPVGCPLRSNDWARSAIVNPDRIHFQPIN